MKVKTVKTRQHIFLLRLTALGEVNMGANSNSQLEIKPKLFYPAIVWKRTAALVWNDSKRRILVPYVGRRRNLISLSGSWSRGSLDHLQIYVSEYENCDEKMLVHWLLKLIFHSVFNKVPQTAPPQQQGAHLKFRRPCNPETTPKPQNLRSAQHTPNRQRQICTPQKIPCFLGRGWRR